MSANGNLREGLRGRVDAVVHSLRETGRLAESIGETAARLAVAGQDQVQGGDQIRTAVESIAASSEETAAATQELVRSQRVVAESSGVSSAGPRRERRCDAGARRVDRDGSKGRGAPRGVVRHDGDHPRADGSIGEADERQRRRPRGGQRRAPGVRLADERHGGRHDRAGQHQRRVDRGDRRDRGGDGEGHIAARGGCSVRLGAHGRGRQRCGDDRQGPRRAGRARAGSGHHFGGDGLHDRGGRPIGEGRGRAGKGARGEHGRGERQRDGRRGGDRRDRGHGGEEHRHDRGRRHVRGTESRGRLSRPPRARSRSSPSPGRPRRTPRRSNRR